LFKQTLISLARPDAPPTLSKSCTDKLALHQCTSLLSAVTSLLINPERVYLRNLILPESQHVLEATMRAFSAPGRMSSMAREVTSKWQNGYGFHPFNILTTSEEFGWSRRVGLSQDQVTPSNKSAVWTPYTKEVIIGGILQGRKQSDPRGACAISRKQIWHAARDAVDQMEPHHNSKLLKSATYRNLKAADALQGRRQVKQDVISVSLHGWNVNEGDSDFSLDD
jgi:tRNA-specific adenosine deaminase 1